MSDEYVKCKNCDNDAVIEDPKDKFIVIVATNFLKYFVKIIGVIQRQQDWKIKNEKFSS